MAKSAGLVTSLTHSSTFSPTYSSRNDLDPRAAPKCLWPSVGTLIGHFGASFKFKLIDKLTPPNERSC